MFRARRLVILDLDNTLYDWVSFFVSSFYAMIDEAVAILNCDKEELLDDLRDVHRRWHDSEHPFALLETVIVASRFPGMSRSELKIVLDRAFHRFNSVRNKELRAYEGVVEGLGRIEELGAILIAHTESNVLAAQFRLNKLNLMGHFTKVYCREKSDSIHPDPQYAASPKSSGDDSKMHQLQRHQRKPSPEVLREILEEFDVSPDNAIYVGDSLSRDMKMAVDVGAKAVWAKYGTRHPPGAYEKLVRVTHWTDEDVARERVLSQAAKLVRPDFVAENGFDEVVSFVERQFQKASSET
ncbi:MAG: HAD family hydrolase [Rhodospirillales bacterium]|jgi:FMN phosphatase YigB (HAD superfamily)